MKTKDISSLRGIDIWADRYACGSTFSKFFRVVQKLITNQFLGCKKTKTLN